MEEATGESRNEFEAEESGWAVVEDKEGTVGMSLSCGNIGPSSALPPKCDGKSLEDFQSGIDEAPFVVFQVYPPFTEEEADSAMALDILRITMRIWGYPPCLPEPGSGDAQPRALSLATWPLLPDGRDVFFIFQHNHSNQAWIQYTHSTH